MVKEDIIQMQGGTLKTLSNATFEAKLENDHVVLSYISGEIQIYYIRTSPGDKVTAELTLYDLTRARTVFRAR